MEAMMRRSSIVERTGSPSGGGLLHLTKGNLLRASDALALRYAPENGPRANSGTLGRSAQLWGYLLLPGHFLDTNPRT